MFTGQILLIFFGRSPVYDQIDPDTFIDAVTGQWFLADNRISGLVFVKNRFYLTEGKAEFFDQKNRVLYGKTG